MTISSSIESTPPLDPPVSHSQKRKATAAGFDGVSATRAVKRRASKACQCCRARKVRCNVTEHGAPCTNCRLDEVECIVSESRRKKKWSKDDEAQDQAKARTGRVAQKGDASAGVKVAGRKLASRASVSYQQAPSSGRASHDTDTPLGEHVPHSIYQTTGHRLNLSMQSLSRRLSFNNSAQPTSPFPILQNSPLSTDSQYFSPSAPRYRGAANLPYFIKPLPSRIGPEEIAYLDKKGVLTVPSITLRNELLRAYIEFVHPYMPLLDLHEFLMIIESGNGVIGRVSLILYQAVMFAGAAFVEMHHLHEAGYSTRKQARKDFFQKTRLLYEFDYESDRVSLVQALLLLTYYYETPDDQKDTWHWMGVATSVAHTIGLHRNPERSNMDAKRTKLWKRIWWSTYMRDRLIALGMRRPTRIKAEDYDVPMMTLDDFDLAPIPDSVTCIPADCLIARDVDKQRQLAIMCIEKARLCLCISHVLSKQYCVLNNNQGMVNDRTTMMLLPKKLDPETCEVKACDAELEKWFKDLPEEAKNPETFTGDAAIDLNRCLLHMVFFTTLSALHRPQVLPCAPSPTPSTPGSVDLLECSRRNVRRAATSITALAQTLDAAGLVKYLPTTGVTVLLPAIIIHLLDIKAPEEETRRNSLRGFCQCMAVMGKLRDIYAAADYSTAFLEAAIRKAGIHVSSFMPMASSSSPVTTADDAAADESHPVNTVEDLVDAGRRMDMVQMGPPLAARAGSNLTPPPDYGSSTGGVATAPVADIASGTSPRSPAVSDDEVVRRLETFLASTPPDSEHASESASTLTMHDDAAYEAASGVGGGGAIAIPTAGASQDARLLPFVNMDDFKLYTTAVLPEFEADEFDALLNLDADGGWSFDDGGVHGFTVDMDWMGAVGGTAAEV